MTRVRNYNGKQQIFDITRKQWVAMTPEEMVRQHFIDFLITSMSIPLSHISVERQIEVNGLTKRYDLVVFNAEGEPWMVVECKAPTVPITQKVLEQVGRYNKTLKANIIGVCNGREKRFFKIDFDTEQIQEVYLQS